MESGESYISQLKESAQFVLKKAGYVPESMVILGSGLGGLIDDLENPVKIPFDSIPHFPHSSVAGHAGMLVIGKLDGKPIAVFEGRVHPYEGYPGYKVAFGVRMLGFAGTKKLVVTNSAGGINQNYRVGDLVLIQNHIGLFCDDPTEGVYHPELGPLFYDMFQPYDSEFAKKAIEVAHKEDIDLKQGVYFYYRQSSYETQAEIQFIAKMGGELVGKSTVPEVMAARQFGIRVIGISCVSSIMAVDNFANPLTHEQIVEEGKRASEKFHCLVKGVLNAI